MDEEFRLIQKEIKQTLVDVMTNILETENTKLSRINLEVMLDKKIKGKVSLTVLEILLTTMYPGDTQKQDKIFAEVLNENKITNPTAKS